MHANLNRNLFAVMIMRKTIHHPCARRFFLVCLALLLLGLALSGCRSASTVPAPAGVSETGIHAWTPGSRIPETRAGDGTGDLNGPLRIDGGHFVDADARAVMLRGINVSGVCKLPARGAEGGQQGIFLPAQRVSFVERPFPLSEARQHFDRLAGWGFHFIRLLVSWEAIEGRGPGIYDREYLNYVGSLVGIAGEAGLRVMIDFHQDVWSRFTGGDGAPRWTLEEAGFNIDRLRVSGAALYADQYADNPGGGVWVANHERLACATMFTLFFGGNDFAPHCRARDGTPIQQFLQGHYIAAAGKLARTLRPYQNVIGFDMMNEPGTGFIGRDALDQTAVFALDVAPTPLQAFAAGAGLPQRVDCHRFGPLGPQRCGRVILNPQGASAWNDGATCVWRREGVWSLDPTGRPRIDAPHHFVIRGTRPVDFANDYYKPFAERFAREIRRVDRRYLIFIEEPVMPEHPGQAALPDWGGKAPAGIVNASHWYDFATLATRHYRSWAAIDPRKESIVLGCGAVTRLFDRQLASMQTEMQQHIGPGPVLVGEFGTPFNRHPQTSLTGDSFVTQQTALQAYYRALENRCLSSALWHYGPRSTVADGDGWNHEDFSIYCADLGNGRALAAAIRPYPLAVPGDLLESRFDVATGEFRCRFRLDAGTRAPCVIFLPTQTFGDAFEAGVGNGGSLRFDRKRRFLLLYPNPSFREHLLVVRTPPVKQGSVHEQTPGTGNSRS